VDWNNTNHLLQALLVAACVFALMHGFNAGQKQ
jgi:hypothetical protein